MMGSFTMPLLEPGFSNDLQHGFDMASTQVKAKAMTILLKQHETTVSTVALTPVVETPLIWRAFSPHSERLKMRPATSHLVSLSFDLISDVVEVGEFLVTNLHNFSSSAIRCLQALMHLMYWSRALSNTAHASFSAYSSKCSRLGTSDAPVNWAI